MCQKERNASHSENRSVRVLAAARRRPCRCCCGNKAGRNLQHPLLPRSLERLNPRGEKPNFGNIAQVLHRTCNGNAAAVALLALEECVTQRSGMMLGPNSKGNQITKTGCLHFPFFAHPIFPLCGGVAVPQKCKTKLRVSVSGFPSSFPSSLEAGLVTSSRRPLFCSQLEPESGPQRRRKKRSAGINFLGPLAPLPLAAERPLWIWIWIWSLLECYWKAGQKDLAPGISTGPEPASICKGAGRR